MGAEDPYRRICIKGYRQYVNAVTNGATMNCPINVEDIDRSIQMYGPDVKGLKGKTARRNLEQIGNLSGLPFPPNNFEAHEQKSVSVNYTFVHGLVHLYSISRSCGFRMVEYIPGKKLTKKINISGVRNITSLFEK